MTTQNTKNPNKQHRSFTKNPSVFFFVAWLDAENNVQTKTFGCSGMGLLINRKIAYDSAEKHCSGLKRAGLRYVMGQSAKDAHNKFIQMIQLLQAESATA